MKQDIDKTVLPVRTLLGLERISIPRYQRPYKWGLKNVSDLFLDIGSHLDKSAYRLGTVVFHRRGDDTTECLDIVDGQQRTLTLLLAVKAIIECRRGVLKRQDLKSTLSELDPLINGFMARQTFASQISEVNLRQNYQELRRLVDRPEFTEDHIDFVLNRCEVVAFVLDDVSEAFQFFDSQNARGRDLAPHDLLKAYHLREFSEREAPLKATAVAHWEHLQSESLEALFATYLFRVRQWAEGKSARFFGKGQVDLFKGVNLDRVGYFPYVESLRIAHHFVDEYNVQYQRKVDGQKMTFPFHLDQMIINGRRFFEMAEHYQRQVSAIIEDEQKGDSEQRVVILGEVLAAQASRIVRTLNTYRRRTRTGDQYVRSMFDCALIFYIDKFGTQSLSTAVEKCFIWAYSCRIRQQVVQLATMDNHVLEINLIRAIRDARLPEDINTLALPTLAASENKNNRGADSDAGDELVKLFREMKYYE
ncbi:hypothetical protein PPGU19_092450 (plasmid) [Paraburkholderia sp. PGU19]|uniref:DUF262 domain-containing protein n=1 Tax=Paraburkholderia sp. PGU19 TaxID=2735434 RepID=UPI0015D9D6A3|nr:DUF262 domain-containing protein [Paraburkholderia sp. PGU19]BCG04677.1 hypothetical protein PPGU19_092450 [Paraburkholderia sp. PGU19]